MKIISTRFLTGAVSPRQYPRTAVPEFAFAGRSNVGKSSLIRSLLNRKKLVKISSTPGKTQMINFFQINEDLVFADLPGYGFAKVPESVKKRWGKMIEEYLLKRELLTGVVFIVDVRRDPTPLDLNLKQWLEAYEIDHVLVVTKSDKLGRGERDRQIKKIRDALAGSRTAAVIPYSSKTQLGRKELWHCLLKMAGKSKRKDPGNEIQASPHETGESA